MGEKITNNAVQVDVRDGVATIEQGTALTRLHYFDGKFLRADALTLEQDYHRTLVRLSNLAGGWGVVHGLGIGLSANLLSVSPGLAITPAGSTVLLGSAISVEVAKLLAAASAAPPAPASAGTPGSATFGDCKPQPAGASATTPATGFYEITVGPLEGLCGNEEVFGKLCEDACVTDSQSPYWKEGLVLRLRRIALDLPASSAVPAADIHLRNRVASAYFRAEPWLSAPLLSGAGLAGSAWCNPAQLYNRDEVPIGLLVQEGAVTRLIDAWSARRERIDSQARGYWQGRMMMRPWNVFTAQILQFQCQLPGAFNPAAPSTGAAQDIRDLLASSVRELRQVQLKYAESSRRILDMLGERGGDASEQVAALSSPSGKLEKLAEQLSGAQASFTALPVNRLLLNAGFMDLPAAGYLPVDPARAPLNDQLKRFFGEGVKLFFCTARPDFIAHAVEEVQHMERISLTRGLDDPANIEEVEILVPNGQAIDNLALDGGSHWTVALANQLPILMILSLELVSDKAADTAQPKPPGIGGAAASGLMGMFAAHAPPNLRELFAGAAAEGDPALDLDGVVRTTRLDSGGGALTLACKPKPDASEQTRKIYGLGMFVDLRISEDPFARQEGDQVPLSLEIRFGGQPDTGAPPVEWIITGNGRLTIRNMYAVDNQTMAIDAVAELDLRLEFIPPTNPPSSLRGKPTVTIYRHGDAKTGRTEVFVNKGGRGMRFNWFGQWKGKPRNAVFGLQLPAPSNGAEIFRPYLAMNELAVALAPENPLRLNALNVLSALAGTAADPAFLARARRQIFPDRAADSSELQVRATLDWIMFRRRRKATCDLSCRCEKAPVQTSMQAWHVRLLEPADLAALAAAVEKDDPEAAKRFKFERVDVLHYADERLSPAETLKQVVADWAALKPGNTGVAGWVWESTPGQPGLPHQERLARLAEMLDPLIAPPPANLLRLLPAAPTAVADPQFSGGMLLASITRRPQTQAHAVFLINTQFAEKIQAMLKQEQADVRDFIKANAAVAVDLPFDEANAPSKPELEKLVKQFADLKPAQSNAIELLSRSVTDAAVVDARHVAVVRALGVGSGREAFKANEPDFGAGVPGATVVFFLPPGRTQRKRTGAA